jgi:deazaflavin-dependent oxidoreductase (nitroreductase family)
VSRNRAAINFEIAALDMERLMREAESATESTALAGTAEGSAAGPPSRQEKVMTMTENTGSAQANGASRYVAPGAWTTHVFNRAVAFLTRHGISIYGSRVLYVRGRTSGEWRTTPVNPLNHEGARYLVAPRGQAQWVRNMRVAHGGELRVGRRTERFTAVELPDAEKPAVLRAYLKRWKFEVGVFFDGVGPDATDEQLLAIAPGYPVFRITEQA